MKKKKVNGNHNDCYLFSFPLFTSFKTKKTFGILNLRLSDYLSDLSLELKKKKVVEFCKLSKLTSKRKKSC